MSQNASLLKNFGLNFGRELILVAIALLLNPYLFHRLGADGFGVVALTGSTAGLLRLLDAGMAHALARFVSRRHALDDREGVHAVVSTGLAVYVVSGLVACAIVAIGGTRYSAALGVPEPLREPAGIVFVLTGISLALRFPGNAFEGALRGLQRFDLSNAAQLADRVVYALSCVVALSLLDRGLVAVGASLLLGAAVAQVVRIVSLRHAFGELKIGPSRVTRAALGEMFGFGLLAFLTQAASFLEKTVGRVLVSAFLGAAALGVYALLITVTMLLFRGMAALTNVVLPMASRLEATSDRDGLRALWIDGSRMAFALVVPAGTWVLVAAGPILSLWVGPELAVHAPLLVALVGIQLLELSAGTGNVLLVGGGRAAAVGVPYVVGSALATAVLWALLAWTGQGLWAVVVSTAAGMLVRRAALFAALRRELDVPLRVYARRALLPATVCALPAGAAAWAVLRATGAYAGTAPTPLHAAALLASGAATLAVFAACAWVVALDAGERAALHNAVARRLAGRGRGARDSRNARPPRDGRGARGTTEAGEN